MKLINRLIVVSAILVFITIYHTSGKQEKTVATSRFPSVRLKDTNISTDLFSPSNIILVKLP